MASPRPTNNNMSLKVELTDVIAGHAKSNSTKKFTIARKLLSEIEESGVLLAKPNLAKDQIEKVLEKIKSSFEVADKEILKAGFDVKATSKLKIFKSEKGTGAVLFDFQNPSLKTPASRLAEHIDNFANPKTYSYRIG